TVSGQAPQAGAACAVGAAGDALWTTTRPAAASTVAVAATTGRANADLRPGMWPVSHKRGASTSDGGGTGGRSVAALRGGASALRGPARGRCEYGRARDPRRPCVR